MTPTGNPEVDLNQLMNKFVDTVRTIDPTAIYLVTVIRGEGSEEEPCSLLTQTNMEDPDDLRDVTEASILGLENAERVRLN